MLAMDPEEGKGGGGGGGGGAKPEEELLLLSKLGSCVDRLSLTTGIGGGGAGLTTS